MSSASFGEVTSWSLKLTRGRACVHPMHTHHLNTCTPAHTHTPLHAHSNCIYIHVPMCLWCHPAISDLGECLAAMTGLWVIAQLLVAPGVYIAITNHLGSTTTFQPPEPSDRCDRCWLPCQHPWITVSVLA